MGFVGVDERLSGSDKRFGERVRVVMRVDWRLQGAIYGIFRNRLIARRARHDPMLLGGPPNVVL